MSRSQLATRRRVRWRWASAGERQEALFVMADGLPKAPGHPFYQKLNKTNAALPLLRSISFIVGSRDARGRGVRGRTSRAKHSAQPPRESAADNALLPRAARHLSRPGKTLANCLTPPRTRSVSSFCDTTSRSSNCIRRTPKAGRVRTPCDSSLKFARIEASAWATTFHRAAPMTELSTPKQQTGTAPRKETTPPC